MRKFPDINLHTYIRATHITLSMDGQATTRFGYNAPIPPAKAALNLKAYPAEVSVYVMPRRVDLVGVTLEASAEVWTIHKFTPDGELIGTEHFAADGDQPIAAFRQAHALAKPPRNGEQPLSVVLVGPLPETETALA